MTDTTPLPLDPHPLPIRIGSDGGYRVGPSRVTVDTVLGLFRHGISAEEIVARFPTVSLADVYGAISHYLRHRAEFDAFLDENERRFDELRAAALANGQAGLKERLLARMAARTDAHAAVPG